MKWWIVWFQYVLSKINPEILIILIQMPKKKRFLKILLLNYIKIKFRKKGGDKNLMNRDNLGYFL